MQGCPSLCCITPGQEQGSRQSFLHMATALPGLWRLLGWRDRVGEGPPPGAALPQLLPGWGRGFLLH